MPQKAKAADHKKGKQEIFVDRSDVVPVFYGNHVQLTVSNLDCKLQFGVIREASEDKVTVDATIEIYLPHSVAASLSKVIADNLEKAQKQIEAMKK